MRCIGCGCDDGLACAGGCSWIWHVPPVCSRCWQMFKEIVDGPEPERLNALPADHPACRVADELLELLADAVPVHYWARAGGASCGARLTGEETFSTTTDSDAVTCRDCEKVLAAADAGARGGALQ